MTDFPSFDEFYRAVNGREPLPWQRRLAREVAASGWPREIGIPTGLGKTSCIDVAVWAMAAEADREPADRTIPTRVWYVVNRRLLVDAAWDHGQQMAALLADPGPQPDRADPARAVLEAVAVALARRGGAGRDPLYLSRLRGNAELGARPPDPSQPSIIFATVPMFASRWLFRGYGTSDAMRSVDAALAGIDSLVLLDEAHLARPLLRLAQPLAQCDVGDPSMVLPESRARPVLVSLTATGETDTPFVLDDDDHHHPVVMRRLGARKPVHLVTSTKNGLVAAIVNETLQLVKERSPSTVVVFANSPRTARSIFEELRKAEHRRADPLTAELLLLTGRVREREAHATRTRLVDPLLGAPAGRDRSFPREQHLVVVATQTLEVGADLDFDVLVTEACGARAVVQRLGRLNRLGDVDDAVGAIVFAENEKLFGIYGEEPPHTWENLCMAAEGGWVDLDPERARAVVGPPHDVPPRVGELLPAHLWEWAKTTTAPPGEAPGELFYDGFQEPDASVSLVWRAVIPENDSELRPAVSAAESIDVPVWEAREELKDVGAGTLTRLRPDRVTVEQVVPERLRPGDVVILPVGAGRYDEYGWAPTAREEVLDLSLLYPPGMPLDPVALGQTVRRGEELAAALDVAKRLVQPPDPDDDVDTDSLATEVLEHLKAAGRSELLSTAEWEALVQRLRPQVLYTADEAIGRLVLVPAPREFVEADLRSDAFDELSFTATSPALAQHLGSVGEVAARIATSLGLRHELVEAVEAAGRHHDLGKVDVRFQHWLDPNGGSSSPVAKSSRTREHWEHDRVGAGWPKGGRHEELSRRLVAQYIATHKVDWDADLVLHLIVSHHGYGRPLVPAVRDAAPTLVEATVEGRHISVPGDLSHIDWGQPSRFHRCCELYGYWGLALLEAIVRQADHEVSSVVVA